MTESWSPEGESFSSTWGWYAHIEYHSGRHRGRGRKQALPPAPAAPLQAEAAKQPYSTADPPTEGNGAGETAGPDDMVDKFVKHPRVQEFALTHPLIGKWVINHPVAHRLARQGIDRVLTG